MAKAFRVLAGARQRGDKGAAFSGPKCSDLILKKRRNINGCSKDGRLRVVLGSWTDRSALQNHFGPV